MAFTTTAGAAGVSLIGTSGVDVTEFAPSPLVASIYVGAQEANDVVVVSNDGENLEANMGKGDDTFTFNGDALEASTVRGNDGDDNINFADTSGLIDAFINGNAGDDTISSGSIETTTIQGGAGGDTISIGFDTPAPVESSSAIDSLVNGNKDDDEITVNGATDALTVRGGQGDDTINSSSALGAVEAFGDDGDDAINTNNEFSDTLTGGDGVDTFTTGSHTIAGEVDSSFTNFDIITDFVAGTSGDTLVFEGVTLDTLLTEVGSYAIGYVIGDTFTVSAGGSDMAIFSAGDSATVLSGIGSIDVLTANNFAV